MNTNQNRREFLKISGSAITLAALLPNDLFAETAAPKKRALKKGFMMNTFPADGKKQSWVEKFKLLKEAGFDGAEPSSHLDPKEILKARDESGLEIASVVCGTHSRWMSEPAPSKRQQGGDGLMQALRDAKAYGAKSVLCVAGVVNESMPYAQTYKWTQEQIRRAVPLAEELGVKIAIENVWNNFQLSPMEAARYVDEFNSPAVGWHFDIGNVMSIGWPEQWIRILGKRIVALHFKEFSKQKMEKEGLRKGFAVEYLEGDNDWPSIMKALDEIDYKGWAIVEPACGPCKEGISTEEFLSKVSSQLDKILAS